MYRRTRRDRSDRSHMYVADEAEDSFPGEVTPQGGNLSDREWDTRDRERGAGDYGSLRRNQRQQQDVRALNAI